MPALRAILPPPPGRSSTLCTVEPGRDEAHRQRVAGTDVGLGPDSTMSSTFEAVRRDVALLTVEVVQQRDRTGPVRVVLMARRAPEWRPCCA